MPQHFSSRVLVVGSGPAGYTAAIYAARANLGPTLVSGPLVGGQMTTTTEVENYPGFVEPVQGPWLMERMRDQAKAVGAIVVEDQLARVDLRVNPFVASGESGNSYQAEAVIIATGAQARWLGLESETRYRGFGVSGCATCDGFFFRNRDVIVVGGGNTAVEEAIYLSRLARSVTLVHRRDALRAEAILQARLFANPKIEMLWSHEISEIVGGGTPPAVTGVCVRNVKTRETTFRATEGVFVAIGHVPASELFRGQLQLDEDGYIVTRPNSTATGIPGVFAAGDVRDKTFRQAVTAAASGCMAALEAERHLAGVSTPDLRCAATAKTPTY